MSEFLRVILGRTSKKTTLYIYPIVVYHIVLHDSESLSIYNKDFTIARAQNYVIFCRSYLVFTFFQTGGTLLWCFYSDYSYLIEVINTLNSWSNLLLGTPQGSEENYLETFTQLGSWENNEKLSPHHGFEIIPQIFMIFHACVAEMIDCRLVAALVNISHAG